MVAVAVSLVLVMASFTLYESSGQTAHGTTLVVYTYSSFFGGSCGGSSAANLSMLLHEFEQNYSVNVELVCPSGNLVSALQSPSDYGLPPADVVVGLDEITAPEAIALGCLLPYAPPALTAIPPWLVTELGPLDSGIPYIVPYEYGFLGIDYTTAFLEETHGAVANATFPELVNNSSWVHQLVTENPLFDITGEEFLAWQIEYYETVLHETNWQGFWQSFFAEHPPAPAPDWSTAFSLFNSSAGGDQMVVSYSTDPAYFAAYGEAGSLNSTVSWWNGTAYGWRTIYGAGIVQGSRHVALAREFENWILNGTFQSYLPENEWEYPANETVPLPGVFAAAIDPASVVALNNATTPMAVASNLLEPGGWLDTWQAIAGAEG
jgi:thiamine transport system substrate-binding protein